MLLVYLSAISPLPPLITGYSSKGRKPFLNILLIYLLISFLTEIISITLKFNGINNLLGLHIYTVVELGLLAWMYYVYFGKVNKMLAIVLISGFTLFATMNAFFLQSTDEMNSYARSLESLLIIIFCLHFFYRMMRKMEVEKLNKYPMFWISTAFLLYFSGILFLSIFSNELLKLPQLTGQQAFIINNTLNILKNILLTIGLWHSRPT